MVPTITGTPAPMPATADVVVPASSPGHRSGGSSTFAAMLSAHGRYHDKVRVSKSGVHWLAEWKSRTYWPVRRMTNHELGMYRRRAFADTSGSCFCTQANLG